MKPTDDDMMEFYLTAAIPTAKAEVGMVLLAIRPNIFYRLELGFEVD